MPSRPPSRRRSGRRSGGHGHIRTTTGMVTATGGARAGGPAAITSGVERPSADSRWAQGPPGLPRTPLNGFGRGALCRVYFDQNGSR